MRKAFPGMDAYFTSFSADEKKAVLAVSGPQRPRGFYLIDLASNGITPLVESRPWFTKADLRTMESVEIVARDGVKLRGYLTLPAGPEQNLPFVILLHGGPHGAADTWGFNWEVQLLASRGYAVLQLNFRGSGGMGRAFEVSGHRQWGRKMQDDVTDATRWLVNSKLADAERICLMGAAMGPMPA